MLWLSFQIFLKWELWSSISLFTHRIISIRCERTISPPRTLNPVWFFLLQIWHKSALWANCYWCWVPCWFGHPPVESLLGRICLSLFGLGWLFRVAWTKPLPTPNPSMLQRSILSVVSISIITLTTLLTNESNTLIGKNRCFMCLSSNFIAL